GSDQPSVGSFRALPDVAGRKRSHRRVGLSERLLCTRVLAVPRGPEGGIRSRENSNRLSSDARSCQLQPGGGQEADRNHDQAARRSVTLASPISQNQGNVATPGRLLRGRPSFLTDDRTHDQVWRRLVVSPAHPERRQKIKHELWEMTWLFLYLAFFF